MLTSAFETASSSSGKKPEAPRELRLKTLRDWYQSTIAAADEKLSKLEGVSHLGDPTVQAAWETERSRVLGVATARIVEMVGKEDADLLREAVAPDLLKDVLLRAGAGCDVLMMIGEGREELYKLAEKRRSDMSAVSQKVENLSGVQRILLGHLAKKLLDLDAKIFQLEERDRWEALEAQRYRSLRQDFLSTLRSFDEAMKKCV